MSEAYDLNSPPIMIRGDRKRLLLLLLAAALFVTIGVLTLSDGSAPFWETALITGFSTVCAASIALQLFHPPMLKLDPSGITWRTVFRTRTWRWSEISLFWVRSKMVVLQLADREKSLMNGRSLGPSWDLCPEDLAALLNQARDRWHTS